MNSRDTLKINQYNKLEIGGIEAQTLAEKFKTPLYVYDEAHIRNMCAVFRDSLKKHYGDGSVLYASKAFSCLAIYKILQEENIGTDVVSEGELYTALAADFPAEKIFFHGNNKLDSEIEYAVKSNIGAIVVDALSEIDVIDAAAKAENKTQNILLRVNPGVEAHTHHYIATARTDSKFGFSIASGAAQNVLEYALTKSNIKVRGLHSHIGSQIFEKKPFSIAVNKVIEFYAHIKDKLKLEFDILNMGGGFGIWYYEGDKKMTPSDYEGFVSEIAKTVKTACQKYDIKKPYLVIEPGRSLVGEAGITLYTVGAIKEIENVKKYISVDGGMFENPRYALYQAKYSAVCVDNNCQNLETVTIAGKCCESGDIICENIKLPKTKKGDIIAVLSTGAYNYSMASNYNRNKVPPAVLVKDGKAHYIIKPQTNEDLIRNDALPNHLK